MPRHQYQEFILFLKRIDWETPSGLKLHLIGDNDDFHKLIQVRSWLRYHLRFHTPPHVIDEFSEASVSSLSRKENLSGFI
jgi:hypothetical protein